MAKNDALACTWFEPFGSKYTYDGLSRLAGPTRVESVPK